MFLCRQLLANNDKVLLYTCESIDGKEFARARKFSFWFNKYSKEHLKKDLVLSVGETNMFASVIYHSDHPTREALENEIETVFQEYSSYK
jgi:hypothetical protein